MEHDDDDPPPIDIFGYWWWMNRWAHLGMFYAHLLGFKERRLTMKMMCQNPTCTRDARHRRMFQDPRRGHDDVVALVERCYCCEECVLPIIDELERQAQYARLVN